VRVELAGHDDHGDEPAQLGESLAHREHAEAPDEPAPAVQRLEERLDGLDDRFLLDRLGPRLGGRLDGRRVLGHAGWAGNGCRRSAT